MHSDLKDFITAQFVEPSNEHIATWAEREIDFALAPNYDTPSHTRYDSGYAVYMRQVQEWLQDYTTREIWIRKCSRACATESILAWLRWIVCEKPAPTYYLTADQLTTERFMESRIKRGFATCPKAAARYRRARVTEHDIRFPDMDFRVSWPTAKGAFKQDGWSNIIADEFPTWKGFAADMLRKRAGSYAFHKIIGLGSPDPVGRHPDGDPVILEYEATDQCRWMMPDPETGHLFEWTFKGLRWPETCKDAESGLWDLERVRREAYFVTPDGTRIDNADRGRINRLGKWIGTNDTAPKHIHGVWIVGPMVPFIDGDFGVLAYRFLEAKRRGHDSLRAYFYENWADAGDMPNSNTIEDSSLRSRELPYARGGKFYDAKSSDGELAVDMAEDAIKGLIITADVQKYHIWWVARCWVMQGENISCGLEDWGNCATLADLGAIIETAQANAVGIDIGYAERYGEVADFCAFTGAIALKGEDNMKGELYLRDNMNPTEGRKARDRGDKSFNFLTWNTDVFRSRFMAAIRGETPWQWYVPKMAGREYVRQVLSTHKIDGVWETRKGYPQDHLFDCEVMQLVLARFDNLIQ